ncbi:hypothetical protein HBI56_192510 [Parastagonospora nodorum]|nr:hypothetical protein HBH56_177820 [Parastagonospora nodorum]QRD06104.1 hypothetical protein JI435_146730 [Parastagonospora nodorum SN15]KAH3931842.1 hypothetical protein HBH54_091990 [Parastagonospora nodorum]KAH3939574.1 hypothetical protein HBH53_232430 [Parastagonospora nodorum]KAH3957453.1 hypothetical protein HBH51_224380 [Parastagonospora nodorum]
MDPMQPPKLPHPGIYLFPLINELVNIASESNPQLRQYKDYIVSIMPLSDVEKIEIRKLLTKNRITPLESLGTIRDCQHGRSWEWDEGNDDHMLKVIREQYKMDWTVLADFLFIGKRASQCKARYMRVLVGNREWLEENGEWLQEVEERAKRAE